MNLIKMLSLGLLLASVGLSDAAFLGNERTWDFVQSVGGLALGKAEYKSDGWYLPLHCDVSGLKTFSSSPTSMNSGLVWVDTEGKVVGQEILITIETGIAQLAGDTSACGALKLGHVKPGKYRVMYRDPDGTTFWVGEVEIVK